MNFSDYDRALRDQDAGLICLTNLEAILSAFDDVNVADLYRTLYKYNDCGPWLSVQMHDGTWVHSDKLRTVENGNVRQLKVGSIVEGSDVEIKADPIDLLKFDDPVEAVRVFKAAVEWVNDEATAAWEVAHPSPRMISVPADLLATLCEAADYGAEMRAEDARDKDLDEEIALQARDDVDEWDDALGRARYLMNNGG